MSHRLEIELSRIVAGGTRIASFTYDGKARNVLIGANVAQGTPRWGEQVNRALRIFGDRKYLVGLVNNEGRRPVIKTFALDKIEGFSFSA